MKRVLLTGGSGFIGHHCIAPLLARARLRSKVWSDLATARDQALAAFGKPPAP